MNLRSRLGRTEIIRVIKTTSAAQTLHQTRRLRLQTEELFAMLHVDPGITGEHIERIIAALCRDSELADECRLATYNSLFDHHGCAALDADAIVMETYFSTQMRIRLRERS